MGVVKVFWSGGKDSTTSVICHLNRGDAVKVVCYVPMFTKDIPLISFEHYAHLKRTAEYFVNRGAVVFWAQGVTYWDWVLHRSSRGKFKGRIFGWPVASRGKCGFKRDSKLKALNGVVVGAYDYEDIGIAADETDRFGSLDEKHRSILVELGYTEAVCLDYVSKMGMLSPHYENSNRDGCVLCPFSKDRERDVWFSDYPEARELVKELQRLVLLERPDIRPLKGYKLFIEDDT